MSHRVKEESEADLAALLAGNDGDKGAVTHLQNSDIVSMKRAWLNEQFAPELLDFQKKLVDDLIALIDNQQDMIDDSVTDVDARFMVLVCQMELERVQYLVQSYLRTRLFKIQKYHQYILNNPDQLSRLSEAEEKFLRTYDSALTKHLTESVLDLLPQQMRGLSDSVNGVSMIREPTVDKHVFVRVLEDIGEFQVDDEDKDDSVDLMAGDLYVLPYRPIRGLLRKNRIALI